MKYAIYNKRTKQYVGEFKMKKRRVVAVGLTVDMDKAHLFNDHFDANSALNMQIDIPGFSIVEVK